MKDLSEEKRGKLVKNIKEEIMSNSSNRHIDIENRLRDRRNVEADIRRSYNKIILENG